MKIKRLFCLLLALALLQTPVFASIADDDPGRVDALVAAGVQLEELDTTLVGADPTTLDIPAASYLLMEASGGKVLVEHNADTPMQPASITKIMSILLVMEALDAGKFTLEDTVTCSEHANSVGGSQIWFKVGETMTVHELLKATIISSANDATTALGELVAGSEEGFVQMMNERAKELGMENTTFTNCTGFDDDRHRTSARDIALMSRELLKHEKVFEYTTVWMDELRGGETQLVNTNKLIRFYKGANGLKTGTTDGAGYCLAATAKRGDMQLIAVNLGSTTTDDRFASARKLLDYGFANYETVTPTLTEPLSALPVTHGTARELNLVCHPAPILLEKGQKDTLTQTVELPETLEAPLLEGDEVGRVIFKQGDETVAVAPITAAETVEKRTFFKTLASFFGILTQMA